MADDPLPAYALNLPAMQNPGLIDWRLSPGSFAATPQMLVGVDGCESMSPANFATSRFHLRQVIRIAAAGAAVDPHPRAIVNEFAVSLIPIGHSLGQVLYSLPLAPGETVRLAVIDWRRQDAGAKKDDTTVSEQLVHDQTRDRTVTETMEAALNEWQRGGSVMGGLAGGGGASGQAGPWSIVGGSMMSVGGAYATSSGTRDLTASTMQKVTDAIHQASNAVREQHSSVVVQVSSQEREAIETRAFANHNRGHSLTVLYHEVLRHYRVVTERVEQYDAVLLPRTNWSLTDERVLLEKRFILQPALLDPGLASAFDALQRADNLRRDKQRNPGPPATPPSDADITFSTFSTRFKVGSETSTNAMSLIVVVNGQRIALKYGNSENYNRDEQFNNDDANFIIPSDPVTPPIRWGDINSFILRKTSGSNELRVLEVDITGIGAKGAKLLHPTVMGATYNFEDDGDEYTLAVEAPPPAPAAPPQLSVEQQLSLDDYAAIERLKAHMQAEAAYYTRLLDLATHPDAYAKQLEAMKWGLLSSAIDAVAPVPLEVMGSSIAFPLLDQDEDRDEAPAPRETLISLPTRGVFAEAHLGHCNVAEEIDETRFWRWDEHPLPFEASEIAPVVPVQPTQGQLPLNAAPMTPPVVGIQPAPALPDPTGLGAALQAITTPNIFRDMSGTKEVQQLLGDLIDGSVSMAQAANRAREIQSKRDTDMDKQERDQQLGVVQAGVDAYKASIQRQKEAAQQVTPAEAQHAIKVADNQVAQGKLTKEEGANVAKAQVSNMKGSTPVPTAKMQVALQFRHSISKQLFDGQFTVIIDGPGGVIDIEEVTTSLGVARFELPKWPAGEYSMTLRGTRTRLPDLQAAVATVPAFGGHDAFDITLNKYVELKGLTLSGNGKLKVDAATKSIVVGVVVQETSSQVTKEVDYAREQGVEIQGEFAFKGYLADKEFVSVGAGGTSIDKGTTGTKFNVTVTFTYLTGGLTIE